MSIESQDTRNQNQFDVSVIDIVGKLRRLVNVDRDATREIKSVLNELHDLVEESSSVNPLIDDEYVKSVLGYIRGLLRLKWDN